MSNPVDAGEMMRVLAALDAAGYEIKRKSEARKVEALRAGSGRMVYQSDPVVRIVGGHGNVGPFTSQPGGNGGFPGGGGGGGVSTNRDDPDDGTPIPA